MRDQDQTLDRIAGRCLLWAVAASGLALGGFVVGAAEEGEDAPAGTVIPLGPLERTGQLVLYEAEPGTHFDGRGLRIRSGLSPHFDPPPRFVLYSAALRDPENGVGYPSTERLEELELPNSERYPLQLRDLASPSISGFEVVGQQSLLLPWRVVKAMWDGDALHVKGCTGHVRVSDVHWENVEDGFGPLDGIDSWILQRAYMKDIRDDAIENDDLVPGEIVDCLIDGCFTFLSQRSDRPTLFESHTMIRDCVIHVEAQVHDGIPGKQWRDRNIRIGEDGIGRAPGMVFKWAPRAGRVEMKNCVIRVDGVSVNGDDDMSFPPGAYENVTLVWLGEGDYPCRLPEGVQLTRDLSAWTKARADWIERLPEDHPSHGRIEP